MLNDTVPQPITGFPTVRTVARIGEERVQLALLHLPPPLAADWAEAGQQHVRQFVNMREGSKGRFLLMGDFNATPWSAVFRRLLRAGFRRAGAGLSPTWPSILGPFGIPIDHVLMHGPIEARSVEVGPDVGSDHRPLLVTLAY
jgi:endonuclease/exonuclease/phosphatase (EEP) superfamily protein YafD